MSSKGGTKARNLRPEVHPVNDAERKILKGQA